MEVKTPAITGDIILMYRSTKNPNLLLQSIFRQARARHTKPAATQRELAGALEEASLIRKLLPSVGTINYHLNLQSSQDIRYADFFTGDRIVFPIRDEQKKLLGLAGRALDDQTPKYLFSKSFPKSKTLFRIEQAASSIRKSAKEGKKDLRLYVCEGCAVKNVCKYF